MDDTATRAGKLAGMLFLAASMSGCITGPNSGPPSLAGFVGVPTVSQSMDNRVNANGNNPQRERMDPLLRLADPANMADGKPPAVKAAAKIKAQKDMKCQKAKAIKYLATIGCSCYDKDGEITKALQASLTDCDEEIRLLTVQAIMQTASDGPCQQCGSGSCCKKELVEQLSKMAWEVDDTGCWIEPSARVRAMAAQAAQMCCPYAPPEMNSTPVPEVPQSNPQPEGVQTPLAPPATQPQGSDDGDSADDEASLHRVHRDKSIAVVDGESEIETPDLLASSEGAAAATDDGEEAPGRAFICNNDEPVVIYRNLAVPVPVDRWPGHSTSAGGQVHMRPTVKKQVAGKDPSTRGIVRYVDEVKGVAHIEFSGKTRVEPGTRVVVHHQVLFGKLASAEHLEVVASEPGAATVRAIGASRITKVFSGDQVVVVQNNS